MSEQNVQTVKAIWDAINRGNFDEAATHIPDDFVFDFSSSESPDRGVYRGLDEIRSFFDSNREAWSDVEFFATEYIDLGDNVVRVGGLRGRGKGSGLQVEATGAQVWTFRDGTPVTSKFHQSKEEALEGIEHSE